MNKPIVEDEVLEFMLKPEVQQLSVIPGWPFPPSRQVPTIIQWDEITGQSQVLLETTPNPTWHPINAENLTSGSYQIRQIALGWPFPAPDFERTILLYNRASGATWWLDHTSGLPNMVWVPVPCSPPITSKDLEWKLLQQVRTTRGGDRYMATLLLSNDPKEFRWLDHQNSGPLLLWTDNIGE